MSARLARCAALAAVCALGAAPRAAVAQAPHYLGCVTPHATIDPRTHNLNRTWIPVFTKPSASASRMSYMVASPLGMWILEEKGEYVRVATGNTMRDWPFRAQAVLGWVRQNDVEGQAIRNCT